MSRTLLAGAGSYVPTDRLSADAVSEVWGESPRGVETVAVPGADEDSCTIAVAAARRALTAANLAGSDVAGLWFATTTPPVAEESLTPRLGAALGVPEAAERGDSRSGTGALLAALASDARPALVVAGDVPRGEPSDSAGQAAGAGGAGVVLRESVPDGHPAGRILGAATSATPYPGTRFRTPGEETIRGFDIRRYDRAAFLEPAVTAVEQLDHRVTGEPSQTATADPVSVEALAVTAPDGDRPARLAGRLDIEPDRVTTPVASVGDTGTAGPLLGMARAAAADASRTLLVGITSGGVADALLVADSPPAVGTDRPTTRVSYTTALRRREEITGDPPAGGGARVSVPTWQRNHAARYRLEAGRCPACGTVSFPGEGACRGCHEPVEYEPVRLPREGTVVTSTGITPAGAPPEFVPQTERGGGYPVALVRFGRDDWAVDLPLQVCDTEPGAVTAGQTVRVVVRLIDRLDGLPRYGAKARPVGTVNCEAEN